MKEITVKVTDRDIDSIIRIGLKPWTRTTDDERKEFNNLINYYGTAVIKKIADSEWR